MPPGVVKPFAGFGSPKRGKLRFGIPLHCLSPPIAQPRGISVMRFVTELLEASRELADDRSYQALTRYDEAALHAFYRSLDPEERRIRFGAAVGDESIARYCDAIDWRSTLVIAFGTARRLDAVALNVRIDGRRVENATVATREGGNAVPVLLRLSAVGARDLFAAGRMLVSLDGAGWLLRHMRDFGSTVVREEFAELDLGSIAGEIALVPDSRPRPRRTRFEARAASYG